MVSFCIYVYLSTFLEGGGGGVKIKKLAYVLWRGCPKTNEGEQGGGGGGSKITKFERTYFLNAPLQEIFGKISVRVLMDKKNVQDFSYIEKHENYLKKIGLEGDLGALKVISLNAHFWRVKIRWQATLSQRPQTWQAYLIACGMRKLHGIYVTFHGNWSTGSLRIIKMIQTY